MDKVKKNKRKEQIERTKPSYMPSDILFNEGKWLPFLL